MINTLSQLPIQRCHVDSLKSGVVGVFTPWNTAKTTHFFLFSFSFFLFWRSRYYSECYQYLSDGRDRSVQLGFIRSFPSVLFMPDHTETQLLRAGVYILNFQHKVKLEVKAHYAMNGQTQFCGMPAQLLLYHIDLCNHL